MWINEWDIGEADAQQWKVTFGHHAIGNNSSWIPGSPVPVILDGNMGFKSLQVTIRIRGDTREEIIGKRSMILSRLITPAQIKLNGYSHRFFGSLKKANATEFIQKRSHRLVLDFDCYEYGCQPDGAPFEESASGVTETVVTNPGNILTPAVVELTPQVGVAELKLNGICRNPNTGADLPVTVRNLTTGKKVILDGETGLMTEDEKLKAGDIDIWERPTLIPGSNTVMMNSDRMNITVRFFPRYM